jgi:hypothetical protein
MTVAAKDVFPGIVIALASLVCPTVMVSGRPPWAGPLHHDVGQRQDVIVHQDITGMTHTVRH